MGVCSIHNCKSRYVKGSTISLFRFPKKESLAEEWLRYCRPKTSMKHGRVCSKHFVSSDYIPSPLQDIVLEFAPKKGRILKPDAVPTQLLEDNTSQPVKPGTINTDAKLRKRKKPQTKEDDNEEPNPLPVLQINNSDEYNMPYSDTGVINGNNDNYIVITDASNISENGDGNNEECNTLDNNIAGFVEVVQESKQYITISMDEYKLLQKTANKFNVLKTNLDKIFTSGQVRCLMTPNMRRVKWSAEDLSAARSLRSISQKCYNYLRTTVGIPLPGFSTLRYDTSMKQNRRKCFKCGRSPTTDSNTKLFRFPRPGKTNTHQCEQWAKFCFPHEPNTAVLHKKLYSEYYMLCDHHFKPGLFADFTKKILHRSAVPEDFKRIMVVVSKRKKNNFEGNMSIQLAPSYQNTFAVKKVTSGGPLNSNLKNRTFVVLKKGVPLTKYVTQAGVNAIDISASTAMLQPVTDDDNYKVN